MVMMNMHVDVFALVLLAVMALMPFVLAFHGAVVSLLVLFLPVLFTLLALGFMGLAVHLGAVLGTRMMLGLVHLMSLGSVVLLGFAMSLVGGFGLQHFSSFRLGLSTMVKAFQGLGETGSLALDSACMGGFCQFGGGDFLPLRNAKLFVQSAGMFDSARNPFGHRPKPLKVWTVLRT